ncbi:MAG: Gfo/Idh/MocA family oxidoreductase [Planctomycetota bacterium]|jgi:predicted dehydrogenase|nr:Gfo/Idh/MocA family oxidoreductase [Planctomycetota bacterium]
MDNAYKLKVAVAGGAGAWGRHYLRAFSEHPRCEVVALVDQSDRTERFAEHYDVPQVFDTVGDLLSDQTPDIVANILPVEAARGAIVACAEAGAKVVCCEKPIAVELSDADQMVQLCRDKGVPFGCGTAYYEVPHFVKLIDWVHDGNLGELISVSIPGGLLVEASGGGCVVLTVLRAITGLEVDWVEGLTEHARDSQNDEDCGCYGWLGLSNGLVCTVVKPRFANWPRCKVYLEYTDGHLWLGGEPVIIGRKGPASDPVVPKFMHEPLPQGSFRGPIERLISAYDTGEEAVCSGHDYRQALEIACALKISAKQGGARVILPLQDRSARVLPALWRRKGGDVTGWVHLGGMEPDVV